MEPYARSSAENQLLQAQRQILEQDSDEEFKGLLRTHVDETHQQTENLERNSDQMGHETHSETSKTDGGLISDGQRSLQEAELDVIRDTLVADAPAKVEHFEIACYRALIARASRERTGMYMGASYPSEGSGTPVPSP